MKRPGGAGGDAAGGGSRDADDNDDAELRVSAMRAVWLTMRDEEPPESGLASLLAAARVKAATMQAPPAWWRRALARLRRPPVLAFATVLVLLGGAVVIVGRGDQAPVSRRGGAVERAELPVPIEPARREDKQVEPRAASKSTAITESPTVALPAKPASVSAPTPARPSHKAPARERASDEDGGGPVPIGGLALPAPGGAGASGELSLEHFAAPAAPAAVHRPPAPSRNHAGSAARQEDAADPAAAVDDAIAAPAGKEAEDIEKLADECATAAERGDCVAVRRLVGKISKSDRRYRARIAKDSAVAKCLAD